MTLPDIPNALRRDASNRAPFMHTYEELFYGDGAKFDWTVRVSPVASPPATAPDWVPPWQTKT